MGRNHAAHLRFPKSCAVGCSQAGPRRWLSAVWEREPEVTPLAQGPAEGRGRLGDRSQRGGWSHGVLGWCGWLSEGGRPELVWLLFGEPGLSAGTEGWELR